MFERVAREAGRLDLLVNAGWGGYTQMESFAMPFWEQPRWRWDDMFQAGARAACVASALAVPHMPSCRGTWSQRCSAIPNCSRAVGVRW